MTHNKSRSGVWLGNIDWDAPHLSSLLQKAEGWTIDQRSESSPREVQVQVGGGWGAGTAGHSALLVAEQEGAMMVLATRVPLPHGEHVRVTSRDAGSPQVRWGVVVEGREGYRTEDREHGVYLNWLRLG